MVSYVLSFPKEVATARLKVLQEEARRFAEIYDLNDHERWWNYRVDGSIVFGFEGEKGRKAATNFWAQCIIRGDRCWPEGWELPTVL